MKIAIIIPAYNEEKRIGQTLKEYASFFKDRANLLVVINNTTDKTEDIVKKYKKVYSNISYLNFKQGGKGFAIMEGFKEALKSNYELIGFVDADLATSPEAYNDLIKNINRNDGIIASRYLKNSIVNPKQSWQRIVVSRIYNILIRAILLLPYRDTQCGAKLFKRKAIEKVISELTMSKWAFDIDLIYAMAKRHMSIKEFPTIWGDKNYSKINFMKSGPWMALAVIRLRLINSPFRFIITTYDKIMKIIYKITKK